MLRILSLAFLLALLTACASKDKIGDNELPEKQLLENAQEKLDNGSYQLAIEYLQALEARFPFGPYAEQAQISLIYAYYRSRETEAAIESADRFIRLHPQHPNIDYAYYLRGLTNFDQTKGAFDSLLPSDPTERDNSTIEAAFGDFATLLAYFPDSEYAADAKSRLVYLRNILARHEIVVANYYLRRGAYEAALNRAANVVEHYPKTPAVSDGLAIMVQSYRLLGKNDLAEKSFNVLLENYPKHPNIVSQGGQFVFDDYFSLKGVEPNWLAKLTGGLFGRSEPKEINNRKADIR